MKKKLFLVLLSSAILLSGCGNSDTANSASKNSESQTESVESSSASEDTIKVEENLSTVEIIVPAEYLSGETQETLDKTAQEEGYQSITLNDDGSATYVMTKARHKELLDELSSNIDSTLSEFIGSEDYPNITDITANDNYTSFTITTKSTELDASESFSVMIFYMYGGLYNIYSGENVDNIHVDFVNADSGEIISSADSSDMQ